MQLHVFSSLAQLVTNPCFQISFELLELKSKGSYLIKIQGPRCQCAKSCACTHHLKTKEQKQMGAAECTLRKRARLLLEVVLRLYQ
ncbi:unnamed protein product [Arabis nemorensis]|uniref:Uncharacterized protein n=1 Tax=Arabis nemorensis TaxID=586526 RepID=A0A565CGH8_9BRAS|nr:unnamed protein product [Arabis nemorensis]